MRGHHQKIREGSARQARRALVAACFGVGSLTCAGAAWAQPLDANPPLPDVLLLLDTSGSMELMMDGCNTDTGLYPDGTGGGSCNGTIPPVGTTSYCDGVTPRTENRWGAEVAALTGDFVSPSAGGTAYSCFSMPRTAGSAFANEFSYQFASGATVSPYDLNYYLNYHRPAEKLSSTTACVYGFIQGASGWNADPAVSHQENPSSGPPPSPDFQTAAIKGYVYDTTTMAPTTSPPTPCSGGFVQDQDGLLNYGKSSIRFGLMTIDSDTMPNTGVTVASDNGNLTFTDLANGSTPDPINGIPDKLTTGLWSYYAGWETGLPPSWTGSTVGRPAGCSETASSGQIFFEVGARNPAAPPWEGRMIRFPASGTAAPDSNNSDIMSAIRVMRPYGANPIAGMMDDAKYYYWTDPQGPAATDPFVSCRPQYIILLTHAAPNLDLQPYCQGTVNGAPGFCPYDYPEYIADGLAKGNYAAGSGLPNAQSAGATGHPVKTFVIGFSMSSSIADGGAASYCSAILTGTAPNQTVNTSSAFCGQPGTGGGDSGTPGNPVYASCCALARIAVNGGTGVPYFADNKTDLQAAFQAILAVISSTATTRATPVLLPQSASSSTGGGPSAALFLSSFTPSPIVPWSGDVQRERYQCSISGGVWGPQQQPVDPNSGDDFAYNLQNSQNQNRNVIMVEPFPQPPPVVSPSPARNASTTIRPWVNGTSGDATGTAFDGLSQYDGVEYGFTYRTSSNADIGGSPTTYQALITPDVLFPSGCTLQQPGAASALSIGDCETVALGYALGMEKPPASWNTTLSPFPSRFYSSTALPAGASPFGGVLHSTPAIETPPSALLRDDSYQAFTQAYTNGYTIFGSNHVPEPRHTVLYVATIDGLLHAFGVDYNAADNYTFVGSGHPAEGGTTGIMNEMWTFIPPAVLPKLMTGVGGGETVLLDGAPVVKDTIFQRTTVGAAVDWHTTLVGGFGSAGGGYYALEVTDPNFANRGATTPNSFQPNHQSTNSNIPPAAPTGYVDSTSNKPLGPHFLWQLIDQNLFAPTGGTPAITTISMKDPDTTTHAVTEVGVAILPGGSSTAMSTTLGCPRSTPKIRDASPPTTAGYQLSTKVRQWGTTGGCPSTTFSALGVPTNPAQGRSLTIVRLDTGEILRTFAVLSDLPTNYPLYSATGSTGSFQKNTATYSYQGRVTQAEFDSPISGTPVPYPSDVGAIAQRVFVGDQDGTIWRLDLSNPDPNEWFVEPFFDAYNATVQGGTDDDTWAVQRSPIVLAPTVSIGRDGNVVLNFGTGNTDSIGTASNQTFVYSVTELPNTTSKRLLANVNWYDPLDLVVLHSGPNPPRATLGEMITGPAAVFDGTYYFATYDPSGGGGGCSSGTAYLWGMDFTIAADSNGSRPTTPPSPPSNGGVSKMLNSSNALVQKLAEGSPIIPGVTITSTSTCAQTATSPDPATGGPLLSMSNVSPASYQISALQGTPGASQGNNTSVAQVNIATSVHTSTLVDSWASIVE